MIKQLALTAGLLVMGTASPGDFGTPDIGPEISSSSSYKVCTIQRVVNGRPYRDVFYMYSDKRSSYWMDPSQEPTKNVTRVEDRLLDKWHIDKKKLKSGFKATGIYDKGGRTILRIQEDFR